MKKAIVYLLVIFGLTAGIWYVVIRISDIKPAKVIVQKFENTDNRLPLNSLEITKKRRDAFITDDDLFGDDKIAERTKVKLGKVYPDGKVEVLDGLKTENEIIIKTSKYLKNRMTVEIVDKNTRL